MPPKCKFENKKIINAAFSVLRKQGWEMISARSIAKSLNSSTTPIYTYLKSMKNLKKELIKKTILILDDYLSRKNTGDKLLDMGVGYILFAKEEKYLFRFLNDEKHMGLIIEHGRRIFKSKADNLSDYHLTRNYSEADKIKYLFVGWMFSHGLADLINNSFDSYFPVFKDEKKITEFVFESIIRYWEGEKNIKQHNLLRGPNIKE